MKKLRITIINLFNYVKNYRKNKFYDKVNKKLEKAVEDQVVEKIILKGEILKMCRKYLRTDANSKYIPKERRNKTEIRLRILSEFGERMNKYNVRITDDLELI